MSEWNHVKGTQSERPKELEPTITGKLYVRKNIKQVTDINADNSSEENHTAIPGWEYDEIVMSKEEYDEYLKLTANPLYEAETSELKARILNLETYIATSTME